MPNDNEYDWNDPFLEGANLDLSGLSSVTRDAYLEKFGPKTRNPETGLMERLKPKPDPFAANEPQIKRNAFRASLENLMRDPEVRAELAQAGANIAGADRSAVNAVAAEFKAQRSDYKFTNQNNSKIADWLLRKHLQRDDLDTESAAVELLRSGFWTVASLNQACDALIARGELEMPLGFSKALSEPERRAVVLITQSLNPAEGAKRYCEFALGRELPDTAKTMLDLRVEHPRLLGDAIMFSWANSAQAAGVSAEDLVQFRKALETQFPNGFTFQVLESFWQRWSGSRAVARMSESERVQPDDLDNLSDDEIENLYRAARTEAARQR